VQSDPSVTEFGFLRWNRVTYPIPLQPHEPWPGISVRDADRSPATFAGLELPEEGLDLAFLHDWFVLNDGRGVLTEILNPRAVVLMHHRWERAEETRERFKRLPDGVASTLPPVTVFGAEGESVVFKPTQGKAAG
jgi:hypothetical protein